MKRSIVALILLIILSPIGDIRAANSATLQILVIPRLELVLPIGEIPLVNHLWSTVALGTGVARLGTTGDFTPGTNSVIAGHLNLPDGTPGAFAHLQWLQVNDYIWVETGGAVQVYQITAIWSVDPSDVAVTYDIPGQTDITLITCAGDLVNGQYSQRLIVRGILV